MTELQFQKRIKNNKNELIFQFSAIVNYHSYNKERAEIISQRFDGDVIVNLTTKEFYISEQALLSLRDNFTSELYDDFRAKKGNDFSDEEWIAYRKPKCDEKIKKMLLETCEKLQKVIC